LSYYWANTAVALTIAGLAGASLAAQTGGPCEEGRGLFLRKVYAAAQAELWKCVVRGAPSRESAWLLAQTYRELKNYDDGFARLARLPSEPSPSVDVLYIDGFLQFRTGKHRESIDVLGRAFHIDPEDWRIHHVFALNYVVLDISEGALHELQVALQLNPRNAELHYQLARFFYSQSRVTESVEASEKALTLEPDYPDVYTNLGLCYEALGDESKARVNYEKAIEINRRLQRTDEWPYLNYASFLIKQEETERSLSLLAVVLEQYPRSARAYYLRGKALRKLERLPEAKRDLERSIALDPQDPTPFYELGVLLRKLGDAAGSKRMLENFQALSKKAASRPR
jgi:Tfp pilus assembly protein PilF